MGQSVSNPDLLGRKRHKSHCRIGKYDIIYLIWDSLLAKPVVKAFKLPCHIQSAVQWSLPLFSWIKSLELKNDCRAGEMTQPVKAPATKPEDLSLTSRTHIIEKPNPTSCYLTSTYVLPPAKKKLFLKDINIKFQRPGFQFQCGHFSYM